MLIDCLALVDNDDDKKSFELLYNSYYQTAYNLAYSILNDITLSENACSEAFLRIARNYRKIQCAEQKQQGCYIIAIVRNAAISMLKSEEPYKDAVSLDESSNQVIAQNKQSDAERDAYDLLKECIEKLSKTEQDIIYLHAVCGYSYAFIAKSINCPEATTKRHYYSAKNKLIELLKKEGITYAE